MSTETRCAHGLWDKELCGVCTPAIKVPDKVPDRVTLEEPPQLAKLLYRLWQGSQMTPYDAELDGQIVLALQPWVEQLKNGDARAR